MEDLKVAIGSDHGGFQYKEKIIDYLKARNIPYVDLGTHTPEACDYPEIARAVCERVISGKSNRGILVCGTGIGMQIAANRFKGIRAACPQNCYCARMSRAHNDSNILTLGQRVLGVDAAIEILNVWLNTEFEGGRHQERIDMLDE